MAPGETFNLSYGSVYYRPFYWIFNTPYYYDPFALTFGVAFSLEARWPALPSGRLLGTASITIPAGQLITRSQSLRIPVDTVPGFYALGYVLDYQNSIIESSEGNNAASFDALTVGPELWSTSLIVPTYALVGGPLTISDTVRNAGSAAGGFSVAFYLSVDSAISTADTLLQTRTVTGLVAGASLTDPLIPTVMGWGEL